MRIRHPWPPTSEHLWVFSLVPLLASCALTKNQALNLTTNLSAYRDRGQMTNRLEISDRDGLTTDFHYLSRGATNKGVTIVFVHGYPASLFTWADIIAPTNPATQPHATELAAKAGLLALDLPGHGFTKSKRNRAQLDLLLPPASAAQSVLKFLDAKVVTSNVVLVGHSLGAVVVLNAARQAAAEAAVSGKDHAGPRKWRVAALVLISPEGAPRTRTDYLSGERQLRGWFTGRLAGWHGLVYRCGWLTRLSKIREMFRYGFWQVEAEAEIRDLTTNKCADVPLHQSKAYGLLMRNRENYLSNRTLVRRDMPGEYDLVSWAGQSFHGKRVLVWGRADKLFPFETHGRFYDALFKPTPSLFSAETPDQLTPNVGHIVPEDSPEAVAGVLTDLLKSL